MASDTKALGYLKGGGEFDRLRNYQTVGMNAAARSYFVSYNNQDFAVVMMAINEWSTGARHVNFHRHVANTPTNSLLNTCYTSMITNMVTHRTLESTGNCNAVGIIQTHGCIVQ